MHGRLGGLFDREGEVPAAPRAAGKLTGTDQPAGGPVAPVPSPGNLSPFDAVRMPVDSAYEIGKCLSSLLKNSW
ncbi:MAG: hypothetical protein IID36_05285 [Planctomycetes bacterium]|nr:hypothetical protein [Planctomycetota bacterium]